MAEDQFKIRRHERREKQKYMENHFTCTFGGPESVMKFSPQRLESPPPKPPIRRYSDQLSVQSLGTYSLKKTNEENQRNDSMLKKYSTKPAYLSLPASLTSDALNECDHASNLLSQPLGVSDQLKNLRENEFYAKSFDMKNCPKQPYASNKFSCKEKFQSVIPEVYSEHLSSKHQPESFMLNTIDKLSRNSAISSKMFMTDTSVDENLKSLPKECHRRHHSDPAISSFNLQSDNLIKFSSDQCCDSVLNSGKSASKYCEIVGSCCKKSYFIMQEMRILKEINEKLWHQLCSLQTGLKNSRKKVFDEYSDVSISGLLSSIYYAQKTKDSAIEERLKLALEERDTAVHELEDLIQTLSKHFDYADAEKVADKGIKKLLVEMESVMNPSKFIKCQRLLLNQIQSFKESKQKCLSQKLRQALIERDNAVEKIKNLEEEVKDMKLCYDLWHSDNKHWEFTMFDIINQVTHQRDTLLSKFDNGFDIGVIYRPVAANKLDPVDHQNMSYESQSKTVESLKNQSINLGEKQQHSISTTEEVMRLKEEILLLNKTLEGERKKREHTEEKCLRVERGNSQLELIISN